MNDKLKIGIRIAGLSPIKLLVERDQEEVYRKAADYVNQLYDKWANDMFAAESDERILARIAFQFALLYIRAEKAEDELADLDRELDKLLHNLPD